MAVLLVLALTVYSIIAALIPQTGFGDPETIAWMAEHPRLTQVARPLGLFSAFGTPAFGILLLWLTASTAVCSWDRTRLSAKRWTAHATVTESVVRRLEEHPHMVVPADDGSLDRSATALRRIGLRVRQGPRLVVGSSGRLGLLGSPLFHWALVAFFVVVSVGQLTRAEGQMGVPVGGSRREIKASYGSLASGRFFRGHTGLTIAVPSVRKVNIVDGIDREPAPRVVLSDGDRIVRDQLVYPNRPLQYGSLVIHRGPFGFTLPVSVETSTGHVVGSLELFVDTDEKARLGTSPTAINLETPSGSVAVTLALDARRGPGGALSLGTHRITTVALETSDASGPTSATAPGVVVMPDGLVLKLGAVGNYSRVTVVNDWSVRWIYILLGIATVGLTLVLVAPQRGVTVLLVDTPEGSELHAIIANRRRDPLFVERAEEAIRSAGRFE